MKILLLLSISIASFGQATYLCIDTSGSGTAQSCKAVSPNAIISLNASLLYLTTTGNTGDVTLAVNNGLAKHIVTEPGNTVLSAGAILPNVPYLIHNNATYWICDNCGASIGPYANANPGNGWTCYGIVCNGWLATSPGSLYGVLNGTIYVTVNSTGISFPAGTLQAPAFETTGTPFTVAVSGTGCSGTVTTTGGAMGGTFTVPAGATTACTYTATINGGTGLAVKNGYACHGTDTTPAVPVNFPMNGSTATTCSIYVASATSGDTIYFVTDLAF
jgi:hypothetical protein